MLGGCFVLDKAYVNYIADDVNSKLGDTVAALKRV